MSIALRPHHNGRAALSGVFRDALVHERTVVSHMEVSLQGETPKFVHVVHSGLMCRSHMLADGRRQITAVLLPGDICNVEAVLTGKADYSVSALTAGSIGEIPTGSPLEINDLAPDLRQAFWSQTLRDAAILREWMIGLGRRNALERTAHLFCELWTRLQHIGLADVDGYEMKVTQSDLGDILGLSGVHVNRTLQQLRAIGFIHFRNGTLRISNPAELTKLAGFDPSYLG